MTAALEGGEWSAARPGCTLPPGKTWYPLYRRLGGTQGRSGWAENLVPTGIQSRTIQPIVSHFTDWATRPTYIRSVFTQIWDEPCQLSSFFRKICVQNVFAVLWQPPVFQIMNLGKIFALYLGKFSNSRGRKVKSLLSKLLGFGVLLIFTYTKWVQHFKNWVCSIDRWKNG